MKLRERIKSIHPMYYVSFLLPLVIMIAIFVVREIYPFGDRCYLRSDMYHQYCPFFTILWDKIHNGGSLFYSWEVGVGANFLALYGYYLSSPLNWFIGFFPREYMIEMMNIIILLKLSLSAVTFTYYVSKRFKKRNITICVFALFYALSGFTAAYSWNLMWFDCMWLLPLVILGLERLVNEDKGLLYTITLGLLILSNYYIAIMVCISLVLYFLVLLITMPVPEKKTTYLQKIGYFTLFSALAGGLSAAILLPEVYALGLTASSDVNFPKTLTQYFSIVTVITRHFANTKVCTGLEHLPNIYCSVGVLFLFPLYIFNRRINAREKAAKTVLLLVFILAFSLNIPNFIWHGFHYPNSLPCRQSFIYVFILLTMCYDAFTDIKRYSPKQLTKALGIVLIFIIWLDHISEDIDFKLLYLNAIFVALYALIAFIYKKTKLAIHYVVFLLFCVAAVECTMNMEETGYSTTGRSAYFEDYDDINVLTDKLAAEDDSFYRIAKAFGYRSKNDSAWHGFNGASIFSSTAYEGITDLFGYLGLEHSMNAYADHGATALVYSLFDIKYIISEKALLNDPALELYATSGDQYLYKCKYTLPLGYMVPSSTNTEWTYNQGNPFLVQNDFAYVTTGVENVFTTVNFADDGENGITITPETRQHIYVYCSNKSVKVAKVTISGKSETYKGINHGRVIDLGVCEPGVTIKIADEDNDKSLNALVYSIDTDKFIQVYNALNQNTLNITKQTDTKIEGTIQVDEAGTLMLSIPYDPSWTAWVDGKKVELTELADALIGIELDTGTHEIKLSYTPRGFYMGLLISISSLAVLFFVYCFYRKESGKTFFPDLKKLLPNKKIAKK